MIKYEWRTDLGTEELTELTDLLGRAAAYDAEPEYTGISIEHVMHNIGDQRFRHLLIWMLPHATALGERDRPEQIAGLLQIRLADHGAAHAALVIDPRFRSIGVTTLLLERVGLDVSGPAGWLGTGAHQISAWAQGNHPAAGRLGNRFLIPRTDRVWKLIRPTAPETLSAAPVLELLSGPDRPGIGWLDDVGHTDVLALRHDGRIVAAAVIDLHPTYSEEFGGCATVSRYGAAPSASTRARRGLLDGLVAIAQESGLSGLIIRVDSTDALWVNPCRLSGFQHDRTDVRYQLGGHDDR